MNIMIRIANYIKTKKFLYLVVAFFAAQSIFFAAAINYKVPSDEEYHYTFINYYAQKSIAAGPIISDQNELFNLGDIQRTPSYLFHYVMSFYLRIVQVFTTAVETNVFMLRLLNISFGVVALFLLVRLARKIGVSQLTTNLTIAWLSMTGMFIWVFAGISYDNLAIALFFLFLLQIVKLYESLHARQLVQTIAAGIALVLVKETYLPIVILGCIGLLSYYAVRLGLKNAIHTVVESAYATWKSSRRPMFILLCVFTVIISVLFIERYAVNLARYNKFNPTCDQVHTVDECMQQGIYRRNTGQKREFEQRKKIENVQLDSLPVFSAKWAGYIYQRTYFYRGMQSIPASQKASRLAIVTALFAGLLLAYGAMHIRTLRPAQIGLAILTIAYLLMVLLYNFNTYRFYGYPFAIQGRYILPILPFIYMAIIGSAKLLYSRLQGKEKIVFIVILVVLVGNNIVVHSPILIYLDGRTILDQPVIGLLRNKIT
jgi:hypothetical protein